PGGGGGGGRRGPGGPAAGAGVRGRRGGGSPPGWGGSLPLAIGMLASQLRHHPAWTASQLAADLAAARDRLGLMQAENLSVGAAFDLSYADLTDGPRRLFRRLGLVPGPDFDAYAAAALDAATPPPPPAPPPPAPPPGGPPRPPAHIPAAISGFLGVRGHWDQSAALHRSALATARQAGDRPGEASTLSTLGALQRDTGDY